MTQQGPVPGPAVPMARADRPLTTSPGALELRTFLASRPITLDDAVAIGLSTNRALALAVEAFYRAHGRVTETRGALSPTLSAATADVYLAHDLQPTANLVATMPIDLSGLLRAATSQSQFQEVAARLDVNRARNQTVADIKAAFYGVLRAKALVAVATENLQNSLDRLKDANLKYQVRAVAYFDVARAQTDVANAQRQVIQAKNAVSNATSALDNAMGIDVLTPLRISETGAVEQPPGVAPPTASALPPQSADGAGPQAADLPAPAPIDLKPADLIAPKPQAVIDDALATSPEFRPLVREALDTRPEVFEADANIAAAKQGILIARRSLLPLVSLSAGYFNFRNSTGTRHVDEPQAQLGLTLPLFDGGVARGRVQQAREDVATAVTNRRQVLDLVTQDVQQSYLNLVQAR
ncbi:MAG TPA: TolC family protein, partial [Chthonomonadaceae bacterium]|nr:TolC family protein [Chthonomonadaceae bacterium]